MLVDSHCHLNYPQLAPNLDDVMRRAALSGVGVMLTINTRLSESKEVQAIADRFPNVFCTVGVHPHDAAEHKDPTLADQIRALAAHPKVVGLGETGLDYHYNNSPHEDQISVFNTHIVLGLELDLPLIIHTREADEDTLRCVREAGGGKSTGVFHCFSGSADLARAALDLGFYISLSGILTFKNANDLRDIAKFVPMDRLLVETDAPFLTPIPHRGKPNEPAYTVLTAEALANVKSITYAAVAEATTDNFFRLFTRASRPA